MHHQKIAFEFLRQKSNTISWHFCHSKIQIYFDITNLTIFFFDFNLLCNALKNVCDVTFARKKNLRCAWTIVKSHQFEKPSIFMRPFSAIRWKSRSHFSNQMLKNFYRHLRWKDKEFENAFVCQSHCEKCLVCHPYYIYTFRSLTSLPHLLK